MKEAILPFLEYALKAPETTLGTVERNTEIKVAYFTLVALGWEPIRDVALGFVSNGRSWREVPEPPMQLTFALEMRRVSGYLCHRLGEGVVCRTRQVVRR